MYFGADYYPEHWERERWEIDAQMMREAHLNVIRIAEFAWHKMDLMRENMIFLAG
jgi:beta-galactosidase